MARKKTCIICWKEHSNTMSKCCWVKCQRKHELNLKEEKKDKANSRINISIQWIEDDVREKAREDIRSVIEPYLKNKKLIIKVGRWKVKTDYQKLKEKLDIVHARYIRERDWNRCVMCGSTENPNNWHLFSRVNISTRYDDINCNCQCWKHNILHEQDSKPYTDWFIANYGQAMYDDLRERWHGKPMKITTAWLSEKIEEYQEKLKKLQGK